MQQNDTKPYIKLISSRIKICSSEQGKTIRELIAYLGLSDTGYYKMINNDLKLSRIIDIAKFFDKDLFYFLLPEDQYQIHSNALNRAIGLYPENRIDINTLRKVNSIYRNKEKKVRKKLSEIIDFLSPDDERDTGQGRDETE